MHPETPSYACNTQCAPHTGSTGVWRTLERGGIWGALRGLLGSGGLSSMSVCRCKRTQHSKVFTST